MFSIRLDRLISAFVTLAFAGVAAGLIGGYGLGKVDGYKEGINDSKKDIDKPNKEQNNE